MSDLFISPKLKIENNDNFTNKNLTYLERELQESQGIIEQRNARPLHR